MARNKSPSATSEKDKKKLKEKEKKKKDASGSSSSDSSSSSSESGSSRSSSRSSSSSSGSSSRSSSSSSSSSASSTEQRSKAKKKTSPHKSPIKERRERDGADRDKVRDRSPLDKKKPPAPLSNDKAKSKDRHESISQKQWDTGYWDYGRRSGSFCISKQLKGEPDRDKVKDRSSIKKKKPAHLSHYKATSNDRYESIDQKQWDTGYWGYERRDGNFYTNKTAHTKLKREQHGADRGKVKDRSPLDNKKALAPLSNHKAKSLDRHESVIRKPWDPECRGYEQRGGSLYSKTKIRLKRERDGTDRDMVRDCSPIEKKHYAPIFNDKAKIKDINERSPGRKKRERSPPPRPTRIHIGRLTLNVTRDHIQEIFGTYGVVKTVEFPVERLHPHNGRGYAYVDFSNPDEAENAMKHMDGGQIDGQEITAAPVLVPARPRRPSPRPPHRHPPPRRHSPPRYRRRSPPPRRRSPPPARRRRSRSRSPRAAPPRRRRDRSSSSSSR